jgi:hypothetical protein
VAFAWNAGGNDNLVDDNGKLTAFGQRVAQYIAQAPVPTVAGNSVVANANGLSGLGGGDATMNFVASPGAADNTAANPAPTAALDATASAVTGATISDLAAAPPAATLAAGDESAAANAAAAAMATDPSLQVAVPQMQS